MSKGHKNLETDKNTDYHFEYFMNNEKINEEAKEALNKSATKNLSVTKPQPSLHKTVSSIIEAELPTVSPESAEVSFQFNDKADSPPLKKSPYGKKIESLTKPKILTEKPKLLTEKPRLLTEKPKLNTEKPKVFTEKWKPSVVVPKQVETNEEKRARSREAYSNLQSLVEKYNVKLSKPFTVNDDPDEMEAEYKMHKDRRAKNNQVKFYKQILLNIVCGIEIVNDKYNPFEFKIKDWSKQIASDMDDYTEVLEELYEKYRDKGGKMAPEMRLLFMIIMSGVTFHLSQTLFGAGGLGETVTRNPNIISKIMGGLMKGNNAMFTDKPVTEAGNPPNNEAILDKIRKSQAKTTTELPMVDSHKIKLEKNLQEMQSKLEAMELNHQKELDALKKSPKNTSTVYNIPIGSTLRQSVPTNTIPIITPETIPNPIVAHPPVQFINDHLLAEPIDLERINTNLKLLTNPKVTTVVVQSPSKETFDTILDSLADSTVSEIDDFASSPARSITHPDIKKKTYSLKSPVSSKKISDSVSRLAKKTENIIKL